MAALKSTGGEMTTTWKRVSKARYWEMLEVLPPAVMGGGGFLVGEPMDTNADGKLTFSAFLEKNGKYFESSRPMTIKEFRAVCPGAADYAYSEGGEG